MKLWVDDIRNAPDESWTVARTVTSAVRVLALFPVEEVSLDHDISHQISLGKNSRPYACDECFCPVAHYVGLKYGSAKASQTLKITIHSANVVAGEEMYQILKNYGHEAILSPMGVVNRLELET